MIFLGKEQARQRGQHAVMENFSLPKAIGHNITRGPSKITKLTIIASYKCTEVGVPLQLLWQGQIK